MVRDSWVHIYRRYFSLSIYPLAHAHLDVQSLSPDYSISHADKAPPARFLPSTGQYNIVICIDDKWIFRFPKSAHAAADLARFLLALHQIPRSELGLDDKSEGARVAWARYYRAFQEKLFPHMRKFSADLAKSWSQLTQSVNIPLCPLQSLCTRW